MLMNNCTEVVTGWGVTFVLGGLLTVSLQKGVETALEINWALKRRE
jgi:hypothetical protein